MLHSFSPSTTLCFFSKVVNHMTSHQFFCARDTGHKSTALKLGLRKGDLICKSVTHQGINACVCVMCESAFFL